MQRVLCICDVCNAEVDQETESVTLVGAYRNNPGRCIDVCKDCYASKTIQQCVAGHTATYKTREEKRTK